MGLFFSQPQLAGSELVKKIPVDCPADYELKGADVHCYEVNNNSVVSQTITGQRHRLCLYVIQLSEQQRVYFKEHKQGLGLWYMLKGNCTWYLQGLGKTDFHEGECKLVYSPGGLLHEAVLEVGTYVMMGLSVPAGWLKVAGREVRQLDYLRMQVEENSRQLIQQLPISCTGEDIARWELLLTAGYPDMDIDAHLEAETTVLLTGYRHELYKSMRKAGMNNGDVNMGEEMKMYIDRNLDRVLDLTALEDEFERTAATLEKKLKGLIGQTVAAYVLERRLQFVYEQVLTTNDALGVIGKQCGLSTKNLMAAFSPRYGFSTRTLRSWGELIFPEHD